MVYKQDPELIFNEEEHSYSKNGLKYVGVNELLKKYIPEFDTSIAKYLAGKGKYENMSEQEVLTKWNDNKNKAIVKGKNVHYIAEMIVKNKLPELHSFLNLNVQYQKEYKMIKHFLYDNCLTDLDQAEIIVSDDEHRIAGTIDFLGYYNGELCIIDWKTNEEISNKGYGSFRKPFEIFDNTTYNKYVFQLNVYAYILKLKGIKIKHLYLAHVKETGIELIKLPKIIFDMQVLFEERLKEVQLMKIETKVKTKRELTSKTKLEFNAMRFGMCCNQAHSEYLKYDSTYDDGSRFYDNTNLTKRIKELYFMYEELEQEIKGELK